jgi:hypothetical protein
MKVRAATAANRRIQPILAMSLRPVQTPCPAVSVTSHTTHEYRIIWHLRPHAQTHKSLKYIYTENQQIHFVKTYFPSITLNINMPPVAMTTTTALSHGHGSHSISQILTYWPSENLSVLIIIPHIQRKIWNLVGIETGTWLIVPLFIYLPNSHPSTKQQTNVPTYPPTYTRVQTCPFTTAQKNHRGWWTRLAGGRGQQVVL